jgi:hypothetical protein
LVLTAVGELKVSAIVYTAVGGGKVPTNGLGSYWRGEGMNICLYTAVD